MLYLYFQTYWILVSRIVLYVTIYTETWEPILLSMGYTLLSKVTFIWHSLPSHILYYGHLFTNTTQHLITWLVNICNVIRHANFRTLSWITNILFNIMRICQVKHEIIIQRLSSFLLNNQNSDLPKTWQKHFMVIRYKCYLV